MASSFSYDSTHHPSAVRERSSPVFRRAADLFMAQQNKGHLGVGVIPIEDGGHMLASGFKQWPLGPQALYLTPSHQSHSQVGGRPCMPRPSAATSALAHPHSCSHAFAARRRRAPTTPSPHAVTTHRHHTPSPHTVTTRRLGRHHTPSPHTVQISPPHAVTTRRHHTPSPHTVTTPHTSPTPTQGGKRQSLTDSVKGDLHAVRVGSRGAE